MGTPIVNVKDNSDGVFTYEELIARAKKFRLSPSVAMFVYYYVNGMPAWEAISEGAEAVGDKTDQLYTQGSHFARKRYAQKVLRSPNVRDFMKWWIKYGGERDLIDENLYRWTLRDSEEELRLAVAEAAKMVENTPPALLGKHIPVYVEAIHELTAVIARRDDLALNGTGSASQAVVFKGGDKIRD